MILTPGVNVRTVAAVTSQTPPTETDTVFIVIESQQGRIDQPVAISSINEFISNFGARVSWSIGYDWCDAFFNEANGGTVYVMRVVGASPTLDTVTFNDSSSAPAITINSIGPAASGLSAAIVSGVASGAYQIVITGLPDGSTLQSYDLFTETDAVNWGAAQNLIRVVAAGTNAPANHVAEALSGGADNHSAVTDVERVAALALMPKGLGCGQVVIPGCTTETIQSGVLNHAQTFNRFALLDTPDTSSSSTLTGLAAAAQADNTIPQYGLRGGLMLSDWQLIPGLVPNTTRSVPPSAIVAALIARSDRASGNPNLAAVGANGIVNYALGKTQVDWTDAQTNALVAAGVNPFRNIYGGERFYGFRTLTNPNTDPVCIMGSADRLIMAIVDQGYKIGQSVLGGEIDGQGHEASIFGSRITAMLLAYYNLGAIFGDTSQDAYVVDTGADVNTPATITARQLNATVGIVPAPYAETVFFNLAVATVTQGI
jgi:hypothetical protein